MSSVRSIDSWRSNNLQFAKRLLKAYGKDPSLVPDWPDDEYDRIYVFQIKDVGGKKLVLGPGGYIFLPRGVPHGLRCNSEKDSRVLIHVIPGADVGFVGMMLEMAVPARERVLREPAPPDLQTLKTLCEKNKINILGPLPE